MTKNSKYIRILMAFGVITLGACQQEGITEGDQKIPLELLITNVSRNVVYPTVKKLHQKAIALNQSTKKYCEDIKFYNRSSGLTSEEHSREAINFMRRDVQQKWKDVMYEYHRYEMMQFGPVKSPLSTTMSSLYSFDTNKKCRTFINIARNRKPNFNITDESNYKLIGLDAVEVLLFIDLSIKPYKSLCRRDNAWDEKKISEQQVDICNYTKQLTADIELKTQKLENDWSIQGNDYNSQILTTNALGSNENAVNQISQALFYLYGGIIDAKVTVPAGLQVFNDRVESCTQSCPERTEHQYSGQSIESIVAALEGFYYLFNGINADSGTDGIGFDDLLISKGYSATAKGMNEAINKALKNYKKHIGVNTLTSLSENVDSDKCLKSTSTSRLVEICALNQDVAAVTNYLQEMEVLLKGLLSRPTSQQGDND